MNPHSLAIQFSTESSIDSRNLLKLKQEEWDRYVGVVTKSQFVKFLRNLLYGDGSSPDIDCGLSSGNNLVCIIYAYPYYEDLVYNIRTSYGTLSEGVREDLEYEETISVSLSTSVSTDHFVHEIYSFEWVGNVYDSSGNVITPPDITHDSKEITLSKKVYGTLKIKYRAVRDIYVLTIEPREDSEQDLFGAVVFATYLNGLSFLEITQPPNLDELASGEYSCGWKGGISTEYPEDDPTRPEYHNAHKKTVKDYCSDEVISEDIYGH